MNKFFRRAANRAHRITDPHRPELAVRCSDPRPAGGHAERAMEHERVQNPSVARRRPTDHGSARSRRARPRHNPPELPRPQTAARDRWDRRKGEPFVAANASRLQTIAWSLLALQLFSIVIGAIGKAVSTPAHPVHLDAGFSINGWLAVLLTFLLARVFAEGTLMREDLKGR